MQIINRVFQQLQRLKGMLSKDVHFREVIYKGALGLVIKIFSAGSIFLMNLVVARRLGSSESGIFFLGFTIVTFAAAIGRLGLENSLVRFIAHSQAIGETGTLHAVFRKSIHWSFSLSVVLLLTIYITNPYLTSHLLTHSGLREVLSLMAFAIPLIALYTLLSYALQGLKQVAHSLTVLSVITPTTILAGLTIFSVDSSLDVAKLYLFGCFVALLIGYYWWSKLSPRTSDQGNQKEMFSNSLLWASCFPLWGVVFLNQIIQWSSQLMLGAWGSSKDVAFYSTAQRTALLTSFILIAINTIVAPKFAAMYAQNRIAEIKRIALWSVRLLVFTSTPIVGLLIVFSEEIMGMFGEDFKSASFSLAILAAGQFINIATGSVGFLLSMTGHEAKLRFNIFVGAVLGVILGVILIPTFGVPGAAVATAAAISIQNLMGAYYVKKIFGFNTLIFWQKT